MNLVCLLVVDVQNKCDLGLVRSTLFSIVK
jgi:hypothetical protein